MSYKRDEHEELLSELLNPELEQARKTEILSNLRDNYTNFSTTYESLEQTAEKLKSDNADLVISNSKLFRQTGVLVNAEPQKKEEDKKVEFSKSITIADFESTI